MDDYIQHLLDQDEYGITLSGSQPEIRRPEPSDMPAFDFGMQDNTLTLANKWGTAFARQTLAPGFFHDGPNAFATMVAANDTYAEHDRKRRNVNTHEKYWVNDAPVYKNVRHNGLTIALPNVAPEKANARIKQVILQRTVQTVKQLITDDGNKLDLLYNQFIQVAPDIRMKVSRATAELHDYSTTVFEFTSMQVVDRALNVLDPGPGPGVAAHLRANAAFFAIELRMVPRNCIEKDDIGIDPAQFPIASNKNTYAPVPLVNGSLSLMITRLLLTDQNHYKDIIAVMTANGHSFGFRATTRYSQEPDSNAFKRWVKEQRNETELQAAEQALTTAYIGRQEGMESLNQCLAQVKMKVYDPTTTSNIILTVPEVFNKYSIMLSRFDTDNPAPVDLCDLARTIFAGFTEQLQERCIDHLENPVDMSFDANFARFQRLRRHATKMESEIRQTAHIAASAARPSSYMGQGLPTTAIPPTASATNTWMGRKDNLYYNNKERGYMMQESATDTRKRTNLANAIKSHTVDKSATTESKITEFIIPEKYPKYIAPAGTLTL
mmetsp:Transcript_42032/g.101279  ORF Transcript_42032/g.101279 Transcript_42032/m.101279 type:complete len:551 (-) Transcript_42032:1501-3153(-)